MTRQEAIESGVAKYTSTTKCKRGHLGERYVSTFNCVDCQAMHAKERVEGMSAEKRTSLLAYRTELKRKAAAAKRAAEAPAKAAEEQRIRTLMAELGLDLKIVREEARKAGEKFYFSGKPCSNGHICKRHVEGGCYECNKMHGRNNMAKVRVERADELKARKKAEYHRNKEKNKPKRKQYNIDNAERLRAIALQYSKENPEVRREISATRRARKRNATPPWLTKEMRAEIKAMHAEANALKAQLGVRFDVDHIVPLDGRHVSGLHVPWNMRVITHAENISRPKVFSEPHLGLAMPLGLGCGATIECYQL